MVVLLAVGLTPARAMAQPASDVRLPLVEAGAAVSFEKLGDRDTRKLGGVGPAVWVARDLSRQTAVAAEYASVATLGARGGRAISIAAGPRLGTGFYRDSHSVGRFYVQLLAGTLRDHGRTSTTVIAGAAADVLIDAPHGVGFHWSLDYRGVSAPAPNLSGARITVGLVFGPHVAH